MKKSATLFMAFACLSMSVFISCKKDDPDKDPEPPTPEPTLTDSRDGKVYKIVTIGTQTWMAENLNYGGTLSVGGSSSCPNSNADSCTKYGRLYTKEAAVVACPSGYHLPSDAEWRLLEHNLGMTDVDTAKTGLGESRGVAQNIGNKLLPGGSSNMNFLYLYNDMTTVWTSTVSGSSQYARLFDPANPGSVYRITTAASQPTCIRCLKN